MITEVTFRQRIFFMREREREMERERTNWDAIVSLCWSDLQKHCLDLNKRKLIAEQGISVRHFSKNYVWS